MINKTFGTFYLKNVSICMHLHWMASVLSNKLHILLQFCLTKALYNIPRLCMHYGDGFACLFTFDVNLSLDKERKKREKRYIGFRATHPFKTILNNKRHRVQTNDIHTNPRLCISLVQT